MRLVFLGTPAFAVPILDRLVADGHTIVGVVTQPGRPAGRHRRSLPSPVNQRSQELGLPVSQPVRVRAPEVLAEIRGLAPEVIVVAAFGQILPPALLEIPPLGSVNVHASLLPRWRGAAPIAAAILAGEGETGITIILIDAGLDTGPILAQRSIAISPRDTTQSLGERLAVLGAELLAQTLPKWSRGQIAPQIQDEAAASYAPPLRKEHGVIDWNRSAEELDRRCRAYYPWPSFYTIWRGKLLKLLEVAPLPDWLGSAMPGQVMFLPESKQLAVATEKGALVIQHLQLEGKRAMSEAEFVRGQPSILGAHLGARD